VEIVIDSSVVVGLLYPNDLWHSQAVALLDAIKSAGHVAVYFDCVATEAVSAATRRLHEKNLLSDVNVLFSHLDAYVPPHTITWILPDVPRFYPDALELIRSFGGKLNFNDALIALACRERNIPAPASFNADFDEITWLPRVVPPKDTTP